MSGVVGLSYREVNDRRIDLGRSTRDGESPVVEIVYHLISIPSRSEHVKFRLNLRGPSRKAKYVW